MSTISNINELPASAEVDIPQPSLRVFALPLSLLLGGAILCLCAFAIPPDVDMKSTATTVSKPVSIEDVQLGWRVVGENPLGPEDNAVEPNQHSWKKVVLQHRSEERTLIEIEFLRPNAWFENWRAEVGRTIDLSLSEPGKSGIAKVVAVEPCPQIKPGTGPVVTGLFRHVCEEGELVRVEIGDDAEPIISTFNHQFWSETRKAFIQATDLQPGEQLVCANESLVSVKRVTAVEGAEPVFNIETHNHHVYSVGGIGVLAHNMCTVRRQLSREDRANLDAGLPLRPKGNGGSAADQVAGQPTGRISASASNSPSAIQKFDSGNGVVEIDIDEAIRGGAGFVDHNNVVQSVKREGLGNDLRNATDQVEVQFIGEIVNTAIISINGKKR